MKVLPGIKAEISEGRSVAVYPLEDHADGAGFVLQFIRPDDSEEGRRVTDVYLSTEATECLHEALGRALVLFAPEHLSLAD